MAELT